MVSDRPMRRRPSSDVARTPATPPPTEAATEAEVAPPQPARPSLRSGHEFGAISVHAPEPDAAPTSAARAEQVEPSEAAYEEAAAERGSGEPLSASVRERMETAFGHDFARVRIHTDDQAGALSRDLGAHAFTFGSDIYLGQEAASKGTQQATPLLAHELAHVAQQRDVVAPPIAPPTPDAASVSDPNAPAEVEAERAAEEYASGTPGVGSAAPAHVSATAGAQTIHRAPTNAPAPQTTPAVTANVSRNDVELIGMRLKSRQVDLASFLGAAKQDIENIRVYFKWVTDVYDRCYGHYELVLQQAKVQADSRQVWMDIISGVATGIAVGLFSEAIIPLEAAKKSYQFMGEVAAEFVEGGIGQVAKSDPPGLAPPLELNPAFKQLLALQQLDKLNALVLSMAVPGAYIYSDPIVECERISAELRVAEAGGQRRISDADVQASYLKLMRFDAAGLSMENQLKEVEPKFDALRKAYMGKQAPTDVRCEQDIWIPWIAKQNTGGEGFWSLGPVLNMPILRNHFVDIGLAARGARGGRLNADVDIHDADSEYSDTAHVFVTVSTAEELVNGAKAQVSELAAYWNDVFLMGPGGGSKGP